MKDYFYNKNYTAIYLHNFFASFFSSVTSIFWIVLLYKMWFPLWLILLFYAFQFLFMWLLSPLSPILSSKIWIANSVLISNFFRIIWTWFLLLVSDFTSIYLFLIFIFFSIHGAIYHPLINWVNSNYVDDNHKWRFNTMNIIFKSISTILATFISWYFIAEWYDLSLFIITIFMSFFSYLPYFLILEKSEIKHNHKFLDVFKYLFSPNFKPNLVPFSFQIFFIVERIFIPLFIYIAIPDFKIVSYIIWFATFIEFLLLFSFWKSIDKFTHKSFFTATLLKSINSLFFLIQNFHFWLIFLNQLYSKITENMYESSFWTLIQKKAKKEFDPFLFTTAKEMILCFTEFIILVIMSFFAYFIWNNIFIVIFSSSFLALWITYKTWKK